LASLTTSLRLKILRPGVLADRTAAAAAAATALPVALRRGRRAPPAASHVTVTVPGARLSECHTVTGSPVAGPEVQFRRRAASDSESQHHGVTAHSDGTAGQAAAVRPWPSTASHGVTVTSQLDKPGRASDPGRGRGRGAVPQAGPARDSDTGKNRDRHQADSDS
jgi:hypothetical protein